MKVASCCIVGALILVGCASDRVPLDQFSRTYTSFYDAFAVTEQAIVVALDGDGAYWTALRAALNVRSSDQSRAEAAARAIVAYQEETVPMLTIGAESLGALDSTVSALIEAANRIRDSRARAAAIDVAQEARYLHTTYSSLYPLQRRRLSLQLAVLQDLVRERGALAAVLSSQHKSDEFNKLNEECEKKSQEATVHWQTARDLFSAAKGQFDLKAYPSKWEADSTGAG